ncbi:MAG: GntR family transcriptional regulator [Desulfomonilaceae bacterium]
MPQIQVKSLHEEVARHIREMIRTGVLNQGDRIIEKDLCANLGISRTPLREALRGLASEGLVNVIPHRGAYVTKPSIRDIKEMFEVMSLLEGYCARKAAEAMTTDELETLQNLHNDLERFYENRDAESYLEVNHRFHCTVQNAADNKILTGMIEGLREKMLLYRHRQLYLPNRFDASIQEHRELMDALRARDGQRAEAAMAAHLMNQCQVLQALYKDK